MIFITVKYFCTIVGRPNKWKWLYDA